MLYSAQNVPFYQIRTITEGPDDLDASFVVPVRAPAAIVPGSRFARASRSLTRCENP
jgi:hypothetical protein